MKASYANEYKRQYIRKFTTYVGFYIHVFSTGIDEILKIA